MTWYNIAHIQPANNAVTFGQADVVRLLQYALESLGHRVTVQPNRVDINAINIVVGYERLHQQTLPADLRYIPYQLEQLGEGGHIFSDAMRHLLQNAAEVWDYAPNNIEFLKQHNITNAKLLPLGYHPQLAGIPKITEDVDVLCYGLMSERRVAILNELEKHCSVKRLQFVYGPQRDAWIARSKITLNLHHYLTKIGEQVRVSYLLNNGRCVVSEESIFDPLGEFCAVVPYEKLVEKCLELLANSAERERISAAGAAGFRQRPMVEYLRTVLNES